MSWVTDTHAAVDMFLNVAGIKGESTDSVHTGEIDISGWSWGMNLPGSATSGPGKPVIKSMTLLKFVDASTPSLTGLGVSGKIVPSALLTVRKTGVTAQEYLKIYFSNIMVQEVAVNGNNAQDKPTETINISFEQYRVEYIVFNTDGSVASTLPSSYNIRSGMILDTILRVLFSGTGSGSVNSVTPGSAFSCSPQSCQPQGFPYNTVITISATPSLLSLFSGWSEVCTVVNNNCQLTLTTNTIVTPTFILADKARIGAPPGYQSFSDAYTAASVSGATTIMLLEDTLPLNTRIEKPLVLNGGYNTDYSRSTSGFTTFSGTMIIGDNGQITADRIAIR